MILRKSNKNHQKKSATSKFKRLQGLQKHPFGAKAPLLDTLDFEILWRAGHITAKIYVHERTSFLQ